MPNIKIQNVDNTTAGISLDEANVVLVFGNIAEDKDLTNYVNKYTLFTTLNEFKEAIGSTCPTYAEETLPYGIYDPGYMMATFLLQKDFQVLYYVVGSELDTRLTTLADVKAQLNNLDLEELEDKSIYSLRFLTTGGYTTADSESVEKVYVKATEYDSEETYYVLVPNTETLIYEYEVADPQPTEQAELDGFENVTSTITDANFEENQPLYTYIVNLGFTEVPAYQAGISYYKELENKITYYVEEQTITTGTVPSSSIITKLLTLAQNRQDCVCLVDHTWNLGKKFADIETILAIANSVSNSYGAMFSPWCKYNVANVNIVLPASVAYLEAFANSIAINPNWYAVAGPLRGNFSGTPLYKYGDRVQKAMSLIEEDVEVNTGTAVNAIINDLALGNIIYGNRTLFKNNGGLVASSFLNIRQLAMDVTKLSYRQAKRFMFEQNDDRLWFNFKADLIELLETMKSGRGIRDYAIHKERTTEKGKLKVLIEIVPIEAVENFDITIALVDGVATVSLD